MLSLVVLQGVDPLMRATFPKVCCQHQLVQTDRKEVAFVSAVGRTFENFLWRNIIFCQNNIVTRTRTNRRVWITHYQRLLFNLMLSMSSQY